VGSNLIALLELLLVFGLVIGFGVWQLASLRRDKQARDKADRLP
jgi:hypothetical protein